MRHCVQYLAVPLSLSLYRLHGIRCRCAKILTFHLFVIFTSTGFLFKRKPSRVCHGKYGCFNKHPGVRWTFFRIRAKLPQSPSDVGTKFTMFTRNGSGEVDDVGVSRLRAAKFNITRRTIFVIHGWRGKYHECLQLEPLNLGSAWVVKSGEEDINLGVHYPTLSGR